MAKFTLNGHTKVKTLKANFKENFGATLRIYIGRSQVNDHMSLAEVGLTTEGIFECRSSLTCGRFIERMQEEFGLKVKVYTCDEWVAVLDGLTLESAGKVKKNAVKADMESMIAYQHTQNEDKNFEIDDNGNHIAEEQTPTHLLSKIFAVLAWVIADIDDVITHEELEAILGIASEFEEFDVNIVRQRLMLEKMAIRDYNSHSALAKQVPEEYRMMMLQALTMVAVSDFKVKESELDVISGLSEIWDLDIDTVNEIVNKIVSGFAASNPDREVVCD